MELPVFLIADNAEYPENVYVVHTETPCFILDIDSGEIKILDGSSPADDVLQGLIEQAYAFYESELDSYEEEDDEE